MHLCMSVQTRACRTASVNWCADTKTMCSCVDCWGLPPPHPRLKFSQICVCITKSTETCALPPSSTVSNFYRRNVARYESKNQDRNRSWFLTFRSARPPDFRSQNSRFSPLPHCLVVLRSSQNSLFRLCQKFVQISLSHF